MKKTDTILHPRKPGASAVDSLVRFDYMPRVVGFLMHGLLLFTIFRDSRSLILWTVIFVQTIIWPHIAFLIGKYSRNGRKAEYRNQLFESFLCGVWMNLVSFQLWPSTVFVLGAAINLLATRGIPHFRNALLFFGAGILSAGAFNGFAYTPESSLATAYASIGFIVIYTSLVAFLSYQTSRKLSMSRQRIHAILNSIQNGLVVIDAATRQIIETNPAAEKMFGVGREEIVGHVCHQFICPAEEGRCPIIDLQQEVDNSERVLLRKNGDAIPILKTVRPFIFDGRECLVESFIDISERKEMVEELRRLAWAVEQSIDGIAVVDLEGNIQFVNSAWADMHGFETRELLGKPLQLFHSSEQFERDVKPFNTQVMQAGSHQGEVGHIRKDGSAFPTWMTTTLLKDEEGRPYGILGIARNITEQKRAEDELRVTLEKVESVNAHLERQTALANKMAVKAEAANIAKSQFLANMSHEIRTPMNAIVGMTHFLLDTELTDEQAHFATIIQQSADSLLAIINDILDFSKIEAGKLDLETIDFHLIRLLDEMNAMLSVNAHEKGLDYICHIDPAVPHFVSGDPGRLRQVLVNLIGNAIKFTSRGTIQVRIERMGNDGPDDDTGETLVFRIEDTGIGIPPEKMETLFEAFTQVDTSTTREFGGTGLGLSIARNLIEMMHGRLAVSSQPGRGSVFTVTIPLSRAEPSGTDETEAADPEETLCGNDNTVGINTPCARILVAEDLAINQEVVAGFLENFGFSSHIVENGRQAIRALENNRYDLVLMDVQMPEMDGMEATRVIRDPDSMVLDHDVPVIALTGHALTGDRQRYLDAGMNDYLTKPIDPKALYRLVLEYLPEKGRHA